MSTNYSVLLVEDDDPLRAVLVDLLRQWGCNVHSADAGAKAIQIARRHQIDISILDMHLPDTTGVEIFRTLRQEIGRTPPAILMSGEATPFEAQRALELGILRFLRKPLDLGTLRSTFDSIVAEHLPRQPRTPRRFPPGPQH